MRIGIDYAWGGPPPAAALKHAAITFVCRYFSLDPGKNLTAREYKTLTDQDLDVFVAWETTAQRALSGEQAGRWDAIRAQVERVKCDMPENTPIYLAVDFEAKGPEIAAYFRGAGKVLGDRTGAYGGYDALKHLFDMKLIHHGWQTYAWSGDRWDPRALIRQYSNDHTLGGVSVDYDVQLPGPAGPYVPSDEHNWIREYDRLLAEHRAPLRRAWLRRTMTRRRKAIWRIATKTSWQLLNRASRYRELLRRTE